MPPICYNGTKILFFYEIIKDKMEYGFMAKILKNTALRDFIK